MSLQELQNAAAEVMVGLSSLTADDLTSDSSQLANYAILVQSEDWNGLTSTAQSIARTTSSKLTSLELVGKAVNRSKRLLPNEAELGQSIPLARRADWPDIRGPIRDALRQSGFTEPESERLVEEASHIDHARLIGAFEGAASSMSHLNAIGETHAQTLIRAIFGTAVAAFNEAALTSVEADIEDHCRAAEERILAAERALQRTLRAADELSIGELAETLSTRIGAEFISTARRAGTIAFYPDYLPLRVRFGSILRRQLCVISAAQRLTWVVNSPTRDALLAPWVHAAVHYPYSVPVPSPMGIDIPRAISERASGRSVATFGTVDSLTQTGILVRDPMSDASITVLLPRFDGLGEWPERRASVQIIGIWHTLDGSPTAGDDKWRLAIPEPTLEAMDWRDWCARQNGLNYTGSRWVDSIRWSWVPSRFGTATVFAFDSWVG